MYGCSTTQVNQQLSIGLVKSAGEREQDRDLAWLDSEQALSPLAILSEN